MSAAKPPSLINTALISILFTAEREGLMPLIQTPTTGHNPELVPSVSHPENLPKIHLVILSFLVSQLDVSPRGFAIKILYAFLNPPAYLCLLDFTSLRKPNLCISQSSS
jgi:hypothetical protein